MLYKTGGISLSFIKYRDTSIIARILTEKFGLQTYIVNGVRSAKSKGKIALFQPLTLLDLVVYHNEKKDIQRISELKVSYPFHDIPFNFKKSSISIFLTEVLVKTLKEEEENHELFHFLSKSFELFDKMPTGFENFHVQMLLKISAFIGLDPENVENMVLHCSELFEFDESELKASQQLLEKPVGSFVEISRYTRNKLLDMIVTYYADHFHINKELKTLEVLREVLG